MQTIAVIGAGVLGRALSWRALLGGFRVVLEDFSPATLEQAVAEVLKKVLDNRDADLFRSGVPALPSANLSTALNVEDAIRDADLIIETAADEMETKLELFTIFDKFARPRAILATTSRTHSITEIAEITSCPEQCIAVWADTPTDPASLTVAPGKRTSQDAIDSCLEVCERLVDSVSLMV